MKLHKVLVLMALILFVTTVIVEKLWPNVTASSLWNPVDWSAYRIYAAPSMPTILAIILLVISLLVPEGGSRKNEKI